ncbi:MAG TPA: helix-turn-helix domain-containing protein [Macellibacteroides fermentans]|uniref:helix-turn-helix domain-containing protein n=1 Tax=Macellibacteroides fermentans TaxID=879969 RepID=UPI002CEA67D7|nr:helix-turn-helix domain-containing protein [Macellibacteroides fermentans]
MHNIYLATIFAGALICLLASLLLFSRRKDGERSRAILSCIVFFSVFNYITRFINLINGEVPQLIVSVPMLVLAIFMVISYIMYPIEVISPGWLNFRRILKLYSPCLFILVTYKISLWANVEYKPYNTLLDMIPHVGNFDVLFRFMLAFLIFMPILFIFFIPYTRRYNNTDYVWMRKYVFTLSLNTLAYILVLTFEDPIVRTLYYYVSVGCSLYIAYMELFVRLIRKPVATETALKIEEEPTTPCTESFSKVKNTILIERLNAYMENTFAWRDPDLSLNTLAQALCTNRTTLNQVIQDNGYESYTAYINHLRIKDFLNQIKAKQPVNFQDAFFDAGYRSRATALRNFRLITGMTPSEYFQKDQQ